MWDFDDYDTDQIVTIICWTSIIIFGFIGLIQFFPSILWVTIILGIGIPAYFLIKKNK